MADQVKLLPQVAVVVQVVLVETEPAVGRSAQVVLVVLLIQVGVLQLLLVKMFLAPITTQVVQAELAALVVWVAAVQQKLLELQTQVVVVVVQAEQVAEPQAVQASLLFVMHNTDDARRSHGSRFVDAADFGVRVR
jgi:hypothetical protein